MSCACIGLSLSHVVMCIVPCMYVRVIIWICIYSFNILMWLTQISSYNWVILICAYYGFTVAALRAKIMWDPITIKKYKNVLSMYDVFYTCVPTLVGVY